MESMFYYVSFWKIKIPCFVYLEIKFFIMQKMFSWEHHYNVGSEIRKKLTFLRSEIFLNDPRRRHLLMFKYFPEGGGGRGGGEMSTIKKHD